MPLNAGIFPSWIGTVAFILRRILERNNYPMSLFVVLPAYNEQQSISPLFMKLCEFQQKSHIPLKVIFVDDGSTDGTSETAVKESKFLGLCMRLVQHPKNIGLGQALKTGLTTFLEIASEEDCVATMDCDDTQPPELLNDMYALVTSAGYDIAIASRYQKGAKVIGLSRFRTILSYGASFLFRTVLPISGVKDYTCGFRTYNYFFLRYLVAYYGKKLFSENGFACTVDILLKSRPLKPRVTEVAMILRYDQKPTVTKMKVLKTTFQTIKLLIKRKIGIF